MREDSQPGVLCDTCGRRYLLGNSCEPCPYCAIDHLGKLLDELVDEADLHNIHSPAVTAAREAAKAVTHASARPA